MSFNNCNEYMMKDPNIVKSLYELLSSNMITFLEFEAASTTSVTTVFQTLLSNTSITQIVISSILSYLGKVSH